MTPSGRPVSPSRPIKIAMACPGIGLVQRGFERMFSDSFALMRDDLDITLFKGGGPCGPKEIVPRFVHRNGRLVKLLPVHKLFGRTPFHSECMTYALAMLPYLRNGAFDIVHTIDPPLTRLLYRMRALLGLQFKLLYTDGAGMAPSDYPPADYTIQIGKRALDEAIAYGHDPNSMVLLPPGVFPERVVSKANRAALRQAYGIDQDVFVILSVAAIDRKQKRTDYLIDEVAKVGGNRLLVLDGSTSHGTPELITYAKETLGDGCRVSQVPSNKVWELYALADVMAHVATFESFGIAIAEAAVSDLPVITDNGPHFQWLLPNPNCWIDARQPGALAAKLTSLMNDRSQLDTMRSGETMLQRFSYSALKPHYAAVYNHVAAMELRRVREADCRKAA